jgi:hypothetical protein
LTHDRALPISTDDRSTCRAERCPWRPRMPALSNPEAWLHAPVDRRGVVAIPIIWVTFLLSLGFHAAMLLFWVPRLPQPPHLSVDDTEPGRARAVLVTRLAPTTASPSPPSPSSLAAATPARGTPPPTAKLRASPPPPALVTDTRPAEPLLPPPPPPVAEPTPAPQPLETDLASYIEARRRARGDPTTIAALGAAANTPPAETENERRDRIVAANLAPSQQTTFGYDPKTGGGVFQLKRIGYDDAEFYFTGWNKGIGRRAKNLIEVRRGNNNDIRQAIIRKIIEIIRDEVQGDFTWRSERMGRQVVLSARPNDTAELEAFLMQEFFSDPRQAR